MVLGDKKKLCQKLLLWCQLNSWIIPKNYFYGVNWYMITLFKNYFYGVGAFKFFLLPFLFMTTFRRLFLHFFNKKNFKISTIPFVVF